MAVKRTGQLGLVDALLPVKAGDAAYDTHARRARLKAQGRKPRIARRPNKHTPICHPA